MRKAKTLFTHLASPHVFVIIFFSYLSPSSSSVLNPNMCNNIPRTPGWHLTTASLVTIFIVTPTHSQTHTSECTHTCAFADDLHHSGREVAHPVVSCAVVMDTAFPASIGVLLQNLSGFTYPLIKKIIIRALCFSTMHLCDFYTPKLGPLV